MFLHFLLVSLLVFCVATDAIKQKIPNLLTMPAIIIALFYYGITQGVSGVIFSLGGLACGMGLFLVIYILGGMGAGDVKLMGAVGSILGWKATLSAFVCTALAGGLYAIIILLIYPRYGREFLERVAIFLKGLVFYRKFMLVPASETLYRPRLCYGIAIAAGTLVSIWIQQLGYTIII